MRNKYINRSRISEAKSRELVKCFSLDLDAKRIASLVGLNRNTINRYLRLLRERIAEYCEREFPLQGEIEVDESYFGPKLVKGKRGRGTDKKTPIFGILERGGKVFTEIIPDCAKRTLQRIIRGTVELESIIHSDHW